MAGGSKTRAAKALGIDRSTLYRRLQRAGDCVQTSLVLADLHVPYHDDARLEAALAFGRKMRPNHVHILGDTIDCYDLSCFTKDPNRKKKFPQELKQTKKVLGRIRRAFPKAEIHVSQGNHELRLQKYLWSKAAALAGLKELNMERLLKLREKGMTWHKLTDPYNIGYLMFHHGSLIRKHSGDTARAHYEKYRRNMIVGHAHRSGYYAVRDGDRVVGAWECPCMCELQAEYDLYPNWQGGWLWVTHSPDGCFEVETVVCAEGQYTFRGNTTMIGETN